MKKIFILTDGEINYGGYSTIAFKIYNNINKYFKCDLKTIIFKSKNIYNEYEICIKENIYTILNNLSNETILFNIFNKYDIFHQKYDLIICCSPWSLLISNLMFNKTNIMYIKGGGITCSINNENYNYDIDNFSLKLENLNKLNYEKIKILPTTELIYNLIMNKNEYTIIRNNLLNSIELSYFNLIKINEENNENILTKKKYDLIVAISDHNRIIKNSDFCCELFKCFPDLKKIVIGINSEKYQNIENTTIINKIISNDSLLDYYKETKITLIPSLFDAGPSTLIEAVTNYCIPIAYKMCGFSNTFGLKVDKLDLKCWYNNIKNNLDNYDINDVVLKKKICDNKILYDVDKFINLIRTI